MASLREYLNAKIKSKGSSLSAEKAKGKKYKSIAAAKKAGALYYTDKSGKLMAAVYAEDLKKPLAPKKSARPKASTLRAKPTSGGSTKTANEKAVDAEIAANNKKIADNKKKLAANRKKIVESSTANKSRKTRVTKGEKPKFPFTVKLTGEMWMKKNTFADYMALSKSEARALGLPATRVSATQHRLRDKKFKDGKGFFRQNTTDSKRQGIDPSRLAKGPRKLPAKSGAR